jgi:alpha/beta superfamily hydrolase
MNTKLITRRSFLLTSAAAAAASTAPAPARKKIALIATVVFEKSHAQHFIDRLALGYVCARMNFRGVGESAGSHDHGIGETDDMALLHAHMVKLYPSLPIAMGGFSFGTFVLSRLNQQLAAEGKGAERLVLVGCAAGKWELAPVPPDTLLIHGEQDDTIPLTDVFDWARPQDLPVVVIPGADHFFHRKLHHIKQIVIAAWR